MIVQINICLITLHSAPHPSSRKLFRDNIRVSNPPFGAEVDRNSKGMGIRSNRYAMVIENLEVLKIQVEKETKQCGLTSAESILEIL